MQADGAVIVFQKSGGSSCVDQLFGIHPDGRVVGDDGTQQLEAQVEPDVVSALVANLEGLGWFTDDMYTTWHLPCGECYTYSVTVTSGDQTKTIGAVDGGTDAPAKYWLVTSRISALLPEIDRSSVMRLMARGTIGLGAVALCACLGRLRLHRHPRTEVDTAASGGRGCLDGRGQQRRRDTGWPARGPGHPQRHRRLERDGDRRRRIRLAGRCQRQ